MFRLPGPVCIIGRNWFEIDDGTLARMATPAPGCIGKPNLPTPGKPEDAVSEDDQQEFDLLNKYVHVLDDKGHKYENAAAYVKHRNRFFGAETAYQQFAEESDDELDETEWKSGKRTITLRQLIEINKHPEAQDVFYRWVRKAYFNKLGAAVDVPKVIHAGMAPKLIEAIEKVKLSYRKTFHYGGFNPRPVKLNGRYRLGTLSEHGIGLATDIEDHTNAQITAADWKFIETFTGKTVDRSKVRWQHQPSALWRDIKEINDLFVKKLAEEIKQVEADRAKAAASAPPKPSAPKPSPPPAAEDVVLGSHKALKEWRNGFFSLEWTLVEDLHANHFTWGATFPNVDLHHFELDV